MIIDAHVHIGRFIRRFDGGEGDATGDLLRIAERTGITRICAISLGDRGYIQYPTPEEFRSANSHVLEAMRVFPGRALGYCYVNPQHREESLEEIERCVVDGGMVAVKFWVAVKASDRRVDPIMERAADLGVPVLQHAWYKTTGNLPDESSPADVADMARRFPTVTIQMAHLHGGGPRGVADIASCPNVVVDTSGGDPETWLVEFAVRELGPERVVFGSDAPGRAFGVQLGKVTGAALTKREREMILYKNMERILKIK